MKTRIIHTRFWKDSYISALNPKEKLVFIYLLTNEYINLCGVYELPDKYIRLDLDITQEELDLAKYKFTKDNKFYFREGWVMVVNHTKYNSYGGGMQKKALLREVSLIPSQLPYTSMDTSMDTHPILDLKKKEEIINNKTEDKNNNMEDARDRLRDKIGKLK
jgi:hypothetical protein